MEENIKSEFISNGFSFESNEENEIINKCFTVCINFKMKPSDLVSSWEVYYLNRNLSDSVIRIAEVNGFLIYLENEQKEGIIKEESNLHFYSNKDMESILNDNNDGDVLSTPPEISREFSNGVDSSRNHDGYSSERKTNFVTPFGRRTNKFVVKLKLFTGTEVEVDEGNDIEPMDDDFIRRGKQNNRCSLAVIGNGPEQGCKFMYNSIEDSFNAINNRITVFAAAIRASMNLEDPSDPTIASQRNAFAVGMISCDGDGRMNEKSITLQSSVESSGGQRVRLDLKNLERYSIFPGQIIGVEGHNPSGHCFLATKLIDHIPSSTDIDDRPAKKLNLDEESKLHNLHPQKLSMIVAAGPFTTTDNLMFEPFIELLAFASRKKPNLLLLIGPFIDSEHPAIKTGNVEKSYDELFEEEIVRRLHQFVEYMGIECRVIIIPSIRDANHDFVFPQPAYEIKPPHLKQEIDSLPNPTTFEVNQVRISCCSVDILRHLCGEELSRNPSDGMGSDRISRVFRNLLNQRRYAFSLSNEQRIDGIHCNSFYPLYPPAEDVPLDHSLSPESLTIISVPDFLILPSDMKYFVKVLAVGSGSEDQQMKCVCVNPGRLAKGEGGGTFLHLQSYAGAHDFSAAVLGI